MSVNRETREAVAKAIFCTANPGHAWFNEPPPVLEYWGNLADAAIAAYWDVTNERTPVAPPERPAPMRNPVVPSS